MLLAIGAAVCVVAYRVMLRIGRLPEDRRVLHVSGWVLGAVLGALLAAGVIVAVRAMPPVRPVRLVDRVAPYLGDTPRPSRLLAQPSASATPFAVARRLFGPVLGDLVTFLDRIVGGAASVRRRLNGLGSRLSVEEFRIEQVVWGVAAMLVGGRVGRARRLGQR